MCLLGGRVTASADSSPDVAALRAHVLALAGGSGCGCSGGRACREAEAFAKGSVDCPPVTDLLTYHVALHELGHLAMTGAAACLGSGKLEREHLAHAWARAAALVGPDERAARALAAAWAVVGRGWRQYPRRVI